MGYKRLLFSFIGVLLLFTVATGQLAFATFMVILFGVGIFFVRVFLGSRYGEVYGIFGLFMLIYGVLTLVTQFELIKNPFEDFFVHNDAAWSYYSRTMDEVVPLKWSQLISGTLLNPGFYDYALAELLYGAAAKFAISLGIEDVRLALRCLSVLMGALTNAMLTDVLLKNNLNRKKVVKSIVLFGCCSYLFITSAIFTRDIFVAFLYTLMGYVILVPQCSLRFLKLLLLCVCSFGARPENGAFAIIYVIAYYMSSGGSRLRNYFFLSLVIAIIIVFIQYTSFVSDSLESLERFDDYTRGVSTGGVFEKIYNLPFPFDKIAMIIYMLLQPLPLQRYIIGDGMSWMTLPFIVSPFLTFWFLICCLWYVFKASPKNRKIAYYIMASFLGFCVIVSASPDLRRGFAIIPGLYGAYCLISRDVSMTCKKNIKYIVWPVILIISVFFQIYVMIK